MIRVGHHSFPLSLPAATQEAIRFARKHMRLDLDTGTLIVECALSYHNPVCAHCLGTEQFDAPKAGAGLVVCPECGKPYVALRFLGSEKGTLWFSFPWPK